MTQVRMINSTVMKCEVNFCSLLVSRQERDITRLVSDDLLLTQSIFITDKFGFDESKAFRNVNNTETPFIVANYQDACINSYGKFEACLETYERGSNLCCLLSGLVLVTCVFLLAQFSIIAVWKFLYQRRRKTTECSRDFNGHIFK
jgi:hypothetical protein